MSLFDLVDDVFFSFFICHVKCMTGQMIPVVKSLLRERSIQLWWPLHVYM